MSKSASGNREKHGKNVKAKSGLNRAIVRNAWGELQRQLHYKTQWHGGELVSVDPRYTSQQCSECGHISPDNRSTQAHFLCVYCGYTNNADVNAALNIVKKAGQDMPVVPVEALPLGKPMKQEPLTTGTWHNHGKQWESPIITATAV